METTAYASHVKLSVNSIKKKVLVQLTLVMTDIIRHTGICYLMCPTERPVLLNCYLVSSHCTLHFWAWLLNTKFHNYVLQFHRSPSHALLSSCLQWREDTANTTTHTTATFMPLMWLRRCTACCCALDLWYKIYIYHNNSVRIWKIKGTTHLSCLLLALVDRTGGDGIIVRCCHPRLRAHGNHKQLSHSHNVSAFVFPGICLSNSDHRGYFKRKDNIDVSQK